MSTRNRNALRSSIATLAVSISACALVIASNTPAMGFRSFGGMPSHGAGLGSMVRGGPGMNRSLNSGALRPMNVGRSTNMAASRTGHGESLPRSTVNQTSRMQETARMQDLRHAPTRHYDGAPARNDNATVKQNQVTENRTNRNTVPEKFPASREYRTERTNDVTYDLGRPLQYRDDVPALLPDVVPLMNTPTVEIIRQNDQYGGGDRTIVRRGRPVFAGGNPPATFVEVDNPCADRVLMVTTAKSVCIKNKVHIEGKEYWYCRTTKEIETKPYSYRAVPDQDCENNTVIQMEYLPQEWKKAKSEDGGCKDTGRTIIQYSPEGLYWMKITWHIWKCRNANGQEYERLGTTTERENTLIQITDEPPVKPTDYTPPNPM
jgi:hypothetical protein